MRTVRFLVTVAAALMLAAIVAGGVSSAAPLPVPYNTVTGITTGLLNAKGDPAGANDWNCKPSAAHPEPVVLVHGTGLTAAMNWGTYSPLLKNEGYCVFALTYGVWQGVPAPFDIIGAMRPIPDSAGEVAQFVDRVRAATGADKVDLVGHSQGTIVSGYYINLLGGAQHVAKVVSLGPAWAGSPVDFVALSRQVGVPQAVWDAASRLCAGCFDAMPSSPVMQRFTATGIYAPGVAYTNIGSRYDFLAPPPTALPPGPNTNNVVVQDVCAVDGSDHVGLAGSPIATAITLNALDPTHPRPVPCMPTQYGTGAPIG
ncbi:esterase/lipase family protein [Aldersonia kunmingensis]|uniref:esterase/lipase family protein n=1 Tax=Aldersonia kunmingensis TaxID=408066 RepID=UPI00082A7D2F|nr:alpha/beta fold hydrolase [Aldersonia kunmingensis]